MSVSFDLNSYKINYVIRTSLNSHVRPVVLQHSLFDSEKRETIARLKNEMRAKGLNVPPDKPDEAHFDSNCITPVSAIPHYTNDMFFFLRVPVHKTGLIYVSDYGTHCIGMNK